MIRLLPVDVPVPRRSGNLSLENVDQPLVVRIEEHAEVGCELVIVEELRIPELHDEDHRSPDAPELLAVPAGLFGE